MKGSKIARGVSLFLVFCLGAGLTLLVTNSCDSGGDGGSGADFDSTLYYTKTEVNNLLDGVFTGLSNDAYQTITGVDFAGRASTPWTVPAGCTAGLFEVNAGATSYSSGPLNIIVSAATTDAVPDIQFTPASAGYSTALFVVPALTPNTQVYAWHTTNHSGSANVSAGITVAVRCRGWLR